PRAARTVAHAAAGLAGARALSALALDRGRLARQEGAGPARPRPALAAAARAAAGLRRLAVVGHDAADARPRAGGVVARTLGTRRLPAREGRRHDERSLVGIPQVWPCLSLRRRPS